MRSNSIDEFFKSESQQQGSKGRPPDYSLLKVFHPLKIELSGVHLLQILLPFGKILIAMTASSSSALKLTSLTGNYYDCCPVFIEKSELVLTASGSTIHALSSKTGDLIGTFSEHSTPITSMKQIVNKDYNVLQILSASLDGTLCLWNLVSMCGLLFFSTYLCSENIQACS